MVARIMDRMSVLARHGWRGLLALVLCAVVVLPVAPASAAAATEPQLCTPAQLTVIGTPWDDSNCLTPPKGPLTTVQQPLNGVVASAVYGPMPVDFIQPPRSFTPIVTYLNATMLRASYTINLQRGLLGSECGDLEYIIDPDPWVQARPTLVGAPCLGALPSIGTMRLFDPNRANARRLLFGTLYPPNTVQDPSVASLYAPGVNDPEQVAGYNQYTLLDSDHFVGGPPMPACANDGNPSNGYSGTTAAEFECWPKLRATWTTPGSSVVRIDIDLPTTWMFTDRYFLILAGESKHVTDYFKIIPAPLTTGEIGDYVHGTASTYYDMSFQVPKQGVRITGEVLDRDVKAVPNITMQLAGTSNTEGPISLTTTTDTAGVYKFDVQPGTYTVTAEGEPVGENGGSMSAKSSDAGACAGVATDNTCQLKPLVLGDDVRADFTYTSCTAPGRRHNGKPITRCPIIFLPGFLGSKIVCDVSGQTLELWPSIPAQLSLNVKPSVPKWGQMLVAPDGIANDQRNGRCNANARPAAGKDGLVALVGGASIYQTTMDFLDQEAGPKHWWALPYDWRKSPELATPALDKLVDQVRDETHATRVVLYAHSMGGLVMRDYIEDTAHQDKVIRIATAGTPYWGAPKSHFAFLEGDTDTPAGTGLDWLTDAGDLQGLAQNLHGLFFLHPSPKLGPWLSLSTKPGTYTLQDKAGELRWTQSLGGNPFLMASAHRWHETHDGFPKTKIDYEAVVGAGTPTVTGVYVRRLGGVTDTAALRYGSGDGTVPLRSATQGASDGADTNGVGVHYVCEIGHVALPGAFDVQVRLRDFLIKGGPVTMLDDNCPYTGVVVESFDVNLAAGNVIVDVNPSGRERGRAASKQLPLKQALRQGIVQVYQFGGRTSIVLDSRTNATLQVSGRNIAMQVQSISSRKDGQVRRYVSGSGAVRIGATGMVTKGGKPVRVTRLKAGKPVTRAVITKRGKQFLVKLVAKAPNGVGVTSYRIGKGRAIRYRKAFLVTPAQLKQLVVSSTDRFGAVEKPHGVRR